MIRILREIVSRVLKEEIGRNFHTLDNDPYSWKNYPGIHVNIYPVTNGGQWFVQVTCDFDDDLSTPLRAFATEEDANSFARENVEKINRVRLAKNIMTDTPTLAD